MGTHLTQKQYYTYGVILKTYKGQWKEITIGRYITK